MESEVRLSTSSCIFLRSRKFLTALILYSFAVSLIVMLVLSSIGTMKALRRSSGSSSGRRYPFDLLDLSQRRVHGAPLATPIDGDAEPDFIFTKSGRGERPGDRAGATAARGSDREPEEGGRGNMDTNTSETRRGGDPLQSVRQHYKSVVDLQPLDFHCDTCALVSSSGQLLHQRAGRHIDRHSCVLRMNLAPTRGFEADVGTKTTARVVGFISTAGLRTKASEFLAGAGRAERYLFWGLNAPAHQGAVRRVQTLAEAHGAEFYSQDDAGEAEAVRLFEKETGKDREKTNSWLSTGWFTMMLAIDMCDEVDVYGMVPDDYCRKYGHKHVRYHYWQMTWGLSECDYYKANEYTRKGGHRFLTEKAIFQRWATRYNVTFHNPDWAVDKGRGSAERPINTPFMRRDGRR